MKSMLKDAAILFAITLIAGVILGFIYQITKEPIAMAQEKAEKEAYTEVFAEADDFKEIETVTVTDWANAGFEAVDINKVLEAYDASDSVIGYVLNITSHEGYGGDINFTMGISKDGTIKGIAILSISETAGLGMRAEEVLKPQFTDKKAGNFIVVKNGTATEGQIDAISGATITSRAVTNAVNGGVFYYQTQLGGTSNESK